ncbi:MAG: hypothetical protein V4689_03680 [Verrucomicrobiota bacterium]
MNSDPHENAAWRTFGMLDADEAAGFDEAMRHDPELRNAYREMDCLATAVAVASTVPVAPRAGQLERLHLRLGLNASKRTNWFGISGWAAAAALTMILLLDRNPVKSNQVVENHPATPVLSQLKRPHVATPEPSPTEDDESNVARQVEPQHDVLPVASADIDGKGFAKVETKRLIQEIEVLRDELENFQERDRKRFEPVAGMSWPIVMRMVPPGSSGEISGGLALNKEEPPITAILGDALTTAGVASAGYGQNVVRAGELATPKTEPSAIPIYDAARDTGTLVVSNLSNKQPNVERYLWVETQEAGKPVYVGRLPESNNQGADSFDFNLGSTGIIPSAFILTEGSSTGEPITPSKDNTILVGPY